VIPESNSQTTIESLVARCNESLQRGRNGGLASLEAYREAGVALLELKEVLPRGQFGPVATERCACSKQWRARLLEVARHWDDIGRALEWADSGSSNQSHKARSVDGALSVLRAWRRAQDGDPRPKQVRSTVTDLKGKLAAHSRYIELLEQELAAASGDTSRQRQALGPDDRRRVSEITTRWLDGRMADDSFAAARQLRAITVRLGWPLRELLHQCGIEGPVGWTFVPRAQQTTQEVCHEEKNEI
jgi:hypothetical protein